MTVSEQNGRGWEGLFSKLVSHLAPISFGPRFRLPRSLAR
jgi:hypothetical protein